MDNYWADRYKNDNTPWDMGTPSPALTAYLQQLINKNQRILIPGAGHAYEAQWLYENGFLNVWIVDLAQDPLDDLLSRCPNFPKDHLIKGDFFDLNMNFDLIIEQTFFCAISPELRSKYVEKMSELLSRNGKLIGVLFDFPLTEKGPPYGGSIEEYKERFQARFSIHKLERCYNSIKPRSGKEIFIHLIRA